ncbi:hypothetical protein [Streptomyces sp. Ac-502]|uniref:hypothetical protein n=1 Tax=Streptomyces sp. Ac-502 TaxID=3342801 RepID=UPI003862792A
MTTVLSFLTTALAAAGLLSCLHPRTPAYALPALWAMAAACASLAAVTQHDLPGTVTGAGLTLALVTAATYEAAKTSRTTGGAR